VGLDTVKKKEQNEKNYKNNKKYNTDFCMAPERRLSRNLRFSDLPNYEAREHFTMKIYEQDFRINLPQRNNPS